MNLNNTTRAQDLILMALHNGTADADRQQECFEVVRALDQQIDTLKAELLASQAINRACESQIEELEAQLNEGGARS